MSQSPDESQNPLGYLLSEYSSFVNIVSLICLGLGLMFFVPIIFLIVMDFFLWIWRMCWNTVPEQPRDTKPPVATERAPASGLATGIEQPPKRR